MEGLVHGLRQAFGVKKEGRLRECKVCYHFGNWEGEFGLGSWKRFGTFLCREESIRVKCFFFLFSMKCQVAALKRQCQREHVEISFFLFFVDAGRRESNGSYK